MAVLTCRLAWHADGSSSAITDSWRERHGQRGGHRGASKTYTSDSGISDAGTSTAGATGQVLELVFYILSPQNCNGYHYHEHDIPHFLRKLCIIRILGEGEVAAPITYAVTQPGQVLHVWHRHDMKAVQT